MLARNRDDGPQLVLGLRAALAHGEVAPDAAVGFRGAAVEGDERLEGSDRLGLGGAGREGAGIEAVKGLRHDPRRGGDAQNFARERDEERTMARRRQTIRNRGIGEGSREQHRAISELRPEVPPDILGQYRALLELEKDGRRSMEKTDRSLGIGLAR